MDPSLHLAYIGPGVGFAFLGSFLALLVSVLASAVSLVVWPFRAAILAFRRSGRFQKAQVKRIIFLGLDGFDPTLAERWMGEGKLPHLSRLRAEGTYRRLRTTCPPLSPVAWSTFATGVNPAKHNIFDFLNRDLRTYVPELSSARIREGERIFRIGPFRFRRRRASVEGRRKSEPFWKILGRHAIGSTILRVPITFPPERFEGRMLSAMSTPDLLGTQGTFSTFSEAPGSGHIEGGTRHRLVRSGADLSGEVPGPQGSWVRFSLTASSQPDEWMLKISGGEKFVLRADEYSPWISLRFRLRRWRHARGIARFLLTSVSPVSLYVTPVEIDPERPALPISHPPYYAAYLAKLLGSYATLGMAEDTWALNEGAISEEQFLQQAKLIQEERESMFFSALERTESGVVACVFDTPDRVQHMFYRYLDGSPGEQSGVIEAMYREMDRIVGRTLQYSGDGTAVFVLSDHGFSSFRRGVNLNAWLRERGYLHVLDGASAGGGYLAHVDWSRTRAYTFGLSGVYLNLRGREAKGIVPPEDVPTLKADLKRELESLLDTGNGAVAIRKMYDSEEVYRGPYRENAPDLIAGYAAGYRASWSAAVGRVDGPVFEDNNKCWSGDHCVDPSLVPGVLFTDQKMEAENPGIEDMAPTALAMFGLTPPGWMEGKPLRVETNAGKGG